MGSHLLRTIAASALVASLVVVAIPVASAANALDPACFILQNARNVFGPLQPLEAAAPFCWIASPIVGPAPPVPDPNGPVHGASVCAALDARLDATAQGTWYELCGDGMSGDANARAGVTQVTVSCTSDGRSCTYQPTYHADLDELAPGEWIVRTHHHLRAVSGGGVGGIVSGTVRDVECRATGPQGTCHAQADPIQITAGNYNTFKWEASWAVFFVDALGEEHLQATGGAAKYIAQYYQP